MGGRTHLMSSSPEDNYNTMSAGLCANCAHARLITSDKASTFLQCELSFTDPRFAKYPRLPVLLCSGYSRKASGE
jgi:hypothetical protein